MGGQTARMSFWDRPLHAMTDELFPDQIAAEPRFLGFLFFVLQAG
jgi:hypothetical protein